MTYMTPLKIETGAQRTGVVQAQDGLVRALCRGTAAEPRDRGRGQLEHGTKTTVLPRAGLSQATQRSNLIWTVTVQETLCYKLFTLPHL